MKFDPSLACIHASSHDTGSFSIGRSLLELRVALAQADQPPGAVANVRRGWTSIEQWSSETNLCIVCTSTFQRVPRSSLLRQVTRSNLLYIYMYIVYIRNIYIYYIIYNIYIYLDIQHMYIASQNFFQLLAPLLESARLKHHFGHRRPRFSGP